MQKQVSLQTILSGCEILNAKQIPEINITGIQYNSKKIQKGNLFIAIPGAKNDGHNFLTEAIKNGATCLIGERDMDLPAYVQYLQVKDSRRVLSKIAANFYGDATQKMKMVGVTGTNGKTTITYLTEWILTQAKISNGVMGTISCRYGDKIIPAQLTTPESLELNAFFSEMVDAGVQVGIMEVSSHALDLFRVEDIHFDICVFTNLTPEHLDFHKSMELYFASKKRLFGEILVNKGKGVKKGIINMDDAYAHRLIDRSHKSMYETFSITANTSCDYYVPAYESSLEGLHAKIKTPQGEIAIVSCLIGSFNLANILAAIAVAQNLGINLKDIASAIRSFPGVPGRLERVANNKGFYIFVDYAHTPDALKNVLMAIHHLDHKRIITLFGCGGDRDKNKRPLMGAEAGKFSDIVFVTSDNPRNEVPEEIIAQIIPGIEESGLKIQKDYFVEPDRKKAMTEAIAMAKPGDVLLIAGKGHEDYQIIGTEKIHFDDREIARHIVAA